MSRSGKRDGHGIARRAWASGFGPSQMQAGFALLVLLAVIGVGSLALMVVVQAALRTPPVPGTVMESRIADIDIVLRNRFMVDRHIPGGLSQLEDGAGLPNCVGWQQDPHLPGERFIVESRGSSLLLSSRGPDQVAGNEDDYVQVIDVEALLRARQRSRLRWLRALYANYLVGAASSTFDAEIGEGIGNGGVSGSGNGSGPGRHTNGQGHGNANANAHANANANSQVIRGGAGPGGNQMQSEESAGPIKQVAAVIQQADLRDALKAYAVAKRQWYYADAGMRLALLSQMQEASAKIDEYKLLHGLTLPASLVGNGGLMEMIGADAVVARDGIGQPLVVDPMLGVVAVGLDGVRGTDDDM